jgi:hypothetical protein
MGFVSANYGISTTSTTVSTSTTRIETPVTIEPETTPPSSPTEEELTSIVAGTSGEGGSTTTVTSELRESAREQFGDDLLIAMDPSTADEAPAIIVREKITQTAVEEDQRRRARKRAKLGPDTSTTADTGGPGDIAERMSGPSAEDQARQAAEEAAGTSSASDDARRAREQAAAASGEASTGPTGPDFAAPAVIIRKAERDMRATETGHPAEISEETETQTGPAAIALNDDEKPFVMMTVEEDINRTNGLPKRLVLIAKKLTSARFRVRKYIIWRKSVFIDTAYQKLVELTSEETKAVSPRYVALVTRRGFNANNFFSFADGDLVTGNVYAYKIEVEYDGNLSAEEEELIGHEVVEAMIQQDERASRSTADGGLGVDAQTTGGGADHGIQSAAWGGRL